SPFAASPDQLAGATPSEPVRTEDGEVIDLSAHDTGGVQGVSVEAHGPQEWHGNTEAAVTAMADQVAAAQRVVVVTEGPGLASRVREILGEAELRCELLERLGDEPAPGQVSITTGALRHGFSLPQVDLVVHTGEDLAGHRGAVDRSERTM